jgi:hypothetical protein
MNQFDDDFYIKKYITRIDKKYKDIEKKRIAVIHYFYYGQYKDYVINNNNDKPKIQSDFSWQKYIDTNPPTKDINSEADALLYYINHGKEEHKNLHYTISMNSYGTHNAYKTHDLLFNDDFIFVHNPKCAGAYVKYFFEINDIPTIKAGTNNIPCISGHATPIDYINVFNKDTWNKRFTFCIIRNPFDRAISLYNYRKRFKQIPDELSFKNYILHFEDKELKQYKFLIDENENIAVKKIYKYEDGLNNIVNDLQIMLPNLNITNIPEDKVNFDPDKNGKYDIKKYFNNKQLINYFVKRYRDDFIIGGYSIKIN